MCERGLLGKWGPNHAADPIVTRYDPKRPRMLQMVAIKRRDTGEYDFALIAPRSSMKYCLEAQREAERAEAAGPDRPAIPAIRLPGQ